MDTKTLQNLVVSALEEIKAVDIQVINTSDLTVLFDGIIVATGESGRQVRALAKNVHNSAVKAGHAVHGMEGTETGEWVLVDLGSVVVHVMQSAVRSHYNLEELWQSSYAKRTALHNTPRAD